MPDHDGSSLPLKLAIVGAAVLLVGGLLLWSASRSNGAERGDSLAPAAVSTAEPAATVAASARRPTPAPRPAPEPVVFADPVLYDNDLGTGSTEFSAVTINESRNRLLIIDDEGLVFEFDLDSRGQPITPPRRRLTVRVGDSDIEGIAWIDGDVFVLAHEVTGDLSIVSLGENVATVAAAELRRTIETGVSGGSGNGIEGVTSVETRSDAELAVVVERPAELMLIDDDARISVRASLDLADASDVWAASDGTFWVVSDEDRVVKRVEFADDSALATVQQLDLSLASGRFEQPEGIAISADGQRLYIVSEAPGAGRFSLGVWQLDGESG